MSRFDETNQKLQAEKAYYAQARVGTQATPAQPPYYGDTCGVAEARPSLRSQAEQQVGYHRQEADKHDRAAAFFRENPAFDEFIQLVRSGAIQF